MQAKRFSERTKIRLGDLRAVRAEMCCAYRAAVAGHLAWENFRAATLGLARIANIDQGQLLDQRVAELEARLAAEEPAPSRPNGGYHAV